MTQLSSSSDDDHHGSLELDSRERASTYDRTSTRQFEHRKLAPKTGSARSTSVPAPAGSMM